MTENSKTDEKKIFCFAAINQVAESNIVLPTERDSSRGFITWGDNNDYPEYLNDLYSNVATLHAIIEGTADMIAGNSVEIDDIAWSEKINDKEDTIQDLVRLCGRDLEKYGGFAINVVRNKSGKVGGLYYIDLKRLRVNEDKTLFYYSKDWSKSYGRVKTTVYPLFDSGAKDASSIYFYSNNRDGAYPIPPYQAAIKSCEIERNVSEYHLNSLYNGFAGSYLINLANGVPSDEQKTEIEEYFNDKYSGYGNAARVVFTFSPDKEHAPTLEKLDTEDFGEKFKALTETSRQNIFTAFRALPQLFGLNQSTGFATQEYNEAFKLYNRTVILPRQRIIANAISKITGCMITIDPFSLEDPDITIKED